MNIYLIRHTSVDVPKGVCYGQTDVPLKASFKEEALVVKSKLDFKPDAVFSSPLSRCVRLANYCGFESATFDNRLKELNFGQWENQEWDKIDMTIWETDWINNPAPEGESFMDMYQRVASFFEELKTIKSDNTLIFTHGGVISCARVYFEQADINETFSLMPQYGEIVGFVLNS